MPDTPSTRGGPGWLPWRTWLAAGMNLGFTVAGTNHPGLAAAMQRAPVMLRGEPWRFVTTLFIYSDRPWKIAVALSLFVLVGTLVECIQGGTAWLTGFVGGAATGEAAGLFWEPIGSGISVAGCGLLGLLLYSIASDRKRTTLERAVWPACGLALSLVLCGLSDIHGPPILAGAAAGALMTRLRSRKPVA